MRFCTTSRYFTTSCAAVVLAIAFFTADAFGQRRPRIDFRNLPEATPSSEADRLRLEEWQKAPKTRLAPGELDQLVAEELRSATLKPAPVASDENFVRRVTLDLTGRLPLPADITEFIADKNSDKRARLIDRLLASEEYAQHWSRYWRDVVTANLTDQRAILYVQPFEYWLQEQFAKNTPWNEIVRAMLTAEGQIEGSEPTKNGAAYFLASHFGPDAANERAAETARIFLGIQIQCAQCHDHPFDQWKRVQFHEFAAFFGRMRERPIRNAGQGFGMQLISVRFGEHLMPDKKDPEKRFITHPRFLTGATPGKNVDDQDRRKALADYITSTDNFYFAAAYVNRIWGVLMGQSFYEPVDDMGPQKEVVMPKVLARLAASFQASNYDIRRLFRDIMTSDTYQRQIRLGEAASQHMYFSAAYPTRLSADALWNSLTGVLGRMGPSINTRYFGRRNGLEALFKQEFRYDPSTPPDEVEGSIPQALFLMNNPVINDKIRAVGTNLLARILKAYPNDDDALEMVYLRVLGRKPTAKERERCRAYLKEVGDRTEAFEDILWVLLNSTEFQTKR
ncbi:MAG: hypothetical protein KatS3mg105_2837 [Gemmatales bacterium]|nr:MAG: hypothetical protein KatS3mg105_2837 [Gemmatales bacterium]